MNPLLAFLLWCLLFILCWPVALLALVAYPVVWLLLLPLRVLGIAVDAVLNLVRAVLFLPARLLGKDRGFDAARFCLTPRPKWCLVSMMPSDSFLPPTPKSGAPVRSILHSLQPLRRTTAAGGACQPRGWSGGTKRVSLPARLTRWPDLAELESARPAVPARGPLERALEFLKTDLLEELWRETPQPELREPLRQAANEASALAWMTPYPLLLLPELLAEKARLARLRVARQQDVYLRSRHLPNLGAQRML